MVSLCYPLCAVLIILSSVSTCYAKNTLFVFGDSLFDPGNNQYYSQKEQTSNWPYGETYFKKPTGRYSDGRLVPDLIAQFANLPILPPYLQPGTHNFTDGTNFASAGSGVLPSTDSHFINLPTQLVYFNDVVKTLNKQLGETEAKRVLNNAVYLFSTGGNDYFGLYMENPNVTHSEIVRFSETVIGNLTNSLKEVYKLGARRIAFQNAGPLGCTPRSISGGNCAAIPTAMGRVHNRFLSLALNKLEKTLPGFQHSIFDYYNTITDRVNNPSKYGFKEGKKACCGNGEFRGSGCGGGMNGTEKFEVCSNPAEHVWFDGGHTTEMNNFQLAKLIWSGPPNITGPRNVKQLFGYA